MMQLFDLTGWALLLVALGMGYLILTYANKEKAVLKIIGFIIGSVVIVATIILAIYAIFARVRYATFGPMRPIMPKRAMMPQMPTKGLQIPAERVKIPEVPKVETMMPTRELPLPTERPRVPQVTKPKTVIPKEEAPAEK